MALTVPSGLARALAVSAFVHVSACGTDGVRGSNATPATASPAPAVPPPPEPYRFVPRVNTSGTISQHVEIEESTRGLRMTGLTGGRLAMTTPLDGKGASQYMPDAPGSHDIHVIVNEEFGYTTFAGLRFQEPAVVGLGNDGLVVVNKEGVRARDAKDRPFISGKIKVDDKDVIAMLGPIESGHAASSKATWPPLSADFRGDFTMDMATMKKLVGDSIALPLAGRFTSLSITSIDDEGTVKIKDVVADSELAGQTFKVTIHALHSHGVPEAQGRYKMTGKDSQGLQLGFVWHDFHVQREGGARLHMLGAYERGRLLGYSYKRSELASLPAGTLLPVLGGKGWQVVKAMGPSRGDLLQIDSGKRLRLFEVGADRAGLVFE